jgi:hypothetical protein
VSVDRERLLTIARERGIEGEEAEALIDDRRLTNPRAASDELEPGAVTGTAPGELLETLSIRDRVQP